MPLEFPEMPHLKVKIHFPSGHCLAFIWGSVLKLSRCYSEVGPQAPGRWKQTAPHPLEGASALGDTSCKICRLCQAVIWNLQVSKWHLPTQETMLALWREVVGSCLGKPWGRRAQGDVGISRLLSELCSGARNQWMSLEGFCFIFVFNESGGFLSLLRSMFFPWFWSSSLRLPGFYYLGREMGPRHIQQSAV